MDGTVVKGKENEWFLGLVVSELKDGKAHNDTVETSSP